MSICGTRKCHLVRLIKFIMVIIFIALTLTQFTILHITIDALKVSCFRFTIFYVNFLKHHFSAIAHEMTIKTHSIDCGTSFILVHHSSLFRVNITFCFIMWIFLYSCWLNLSAIKKFKWPKCSDTVNVMYSSRHKNVIMLLFGGRVVYWNSLCNKSLEKLILRRILRTFWVMSPKKRVLTIKPLMASSILLCLSYSGCFRPSI